MADDVAGEITRSLNAMSRAVKDGLKKVRIEAAKTAREEHRAQAVAAAGSDRRLRNAGVLDVRTKYAGDDVDVVPFGAWGLVEDGADPHTMPAWGRGTAKHPGTRAKQGRKRWTKGQEAVKDRLDEQVPRIMDDGVERAFRG